MSLTSWIGIAILIVLIVAGTLTYRYVRRKFIRMDGFKGIITERGKRPPRSGHDWDKDRK